MLKLFSQPTQQDIHSKLWCDIQHEPLYMNPPATGMSSPSSNRKHKHIPPPKTKCRPYKNALTHVITSRPPNRTHNQGGLHKERDRHRRWSLLDSLLSLVPSPQVNIQAFTPSSWHKCLFYIPFLLSTVHRMEPIQSNHQPSENMKRSLPPVAQYLSREWSSFLYPTLRVNNHM